VSVLCVLAYLLNCWLFLFSGRMSGLDYAVISKWFDWVMSNSSVTVDLIGTSYIDAVIVLESSLVCCHQRFLQCDLERIVPV